MNRKTGCLAILLFIFAAAFIHAEFFITGAPTIVFDYEKKKESAPTPVLYAFGIGGILFSDKPVNLEISETFFYNYYDLASDGTAVFTEIENRTATGFSFFTEATARWNKVVGRHRFSVGGGLGLLARFAMRSDSVPEDEVWKISEINKDFWRGMSFLYPEIAVSWMYDAAEKIQAGLESKVYFGTDRTIVSFAFKIAFGKHKRNVDEKETTFLTQEDE